MKVKLNDTLHFSEIQREPFVAGDTVDLPDRQAKDLIDRGLAKAVGATPRNQAKGAAPRNQSRGSRRR